MTDITCIPAGGPAAATAGAGGLPPLPDFQNTELWPLLLRWSNAATGAPKIAAAEHVEGALGRLMRDYAGAVLARVGTLPSQPNDGRGEPEREAFEAWVVEFDCGPNLDRTACFYDSFNVQRAWAAWLAGVAWRALTAAPAEPAAPADPVLVPRRFVPVGKSEPKCRDCADFGPICPNSGKPCGSVAPIGAAQKGRAD
ncbi:hypothetical protein [uncultured Xylophilus sp.]|uniref:hypothetical protein n=1 Tax=uncultured Xylophilus sp. TaxID=296832 RepID=UPI0025F9451F|nr:hypothetical protein [uncultured Xylophilus sp.]